jgi:hypothetical protein
MVQEFGFVVVASLLLSAAPAAAQEASGARVEIGAATTAPAVTSTPAAPAKAEPAAPAEAADAAETSTADTEPAEAPAITTAAAGPGGLLLSFMAGGAFGSTDQVDKDSSLLKELELGVLVRTGRIRSGVLVQAGTRHSLVSYGAGLLAGPTWKITAHESLDALVELGVQHFSRGTYDNGGGAVTSVQGAEKTLPYLGLRVTTVHDDGLGVGVGLFAQWTLGSTEADYSTLTCSRGIAPCVVTPHTGRYGGMAAGVSVSVDYSTWSK